MNIKRRYAKAQYWHAFDCDTIVQDAKILSFNKNRGPYEGIIVKARLELSTVPRESVKQRQNKVRLFCYFDELLRLLG